MPLFFNFQDSPEVTNYKLAKRMALYEVMKHNNTYMIQVQRYYFPLKLLYKKRNSIDSKNHNAFKDIVTIEKIG